MKLRTIAEKRPDLLTERDLSSLVNELARLGRWRLRYHTYTSRGTQYGRPAAPGFPDWVFVHPEKRRLLFVELKSESGKVKPEQQEWIDALNLIPGVEAVIWRPSMWNEIVETLTGRKPVAPTPAPERSKAA
jgi:hypothetical protein